jgi:hypothetical protein
MYQNLNNKEDIMDRIIVIREIVEQKVTQVSGALQLGISVRHMRRLQRRYEVGGNSGLLRKSSGGNRGFSTVLLPSKKKTPIAP